MLPGAKLEMLRRRSRMVCSARRPNLIQCSICFSIQVSSTWVSGDVAVRWRPTRGGDSCVVVHEGLSGLGGEFAREQVAQHVGDGDTAPEGGDLDAAAQRWRDIDGQPRGEGGGVTARRGASGALIQLSALPGRAAKPRPVARSLMARSSRSRRPARRPRARRRSARRSRRQPAGLRGVGEDDALADGAASTGGS